MNPSAAPSDLPSVSLNPSSAPSDVPSVSMNPSAAPSDVPSLSMNPSAAPSDQPSKLPSSQPSLSNSPSANPSSEFDRVFQIKSTFVAFGSNWCLTAADKNIGSKLHVRPCKYYATEAENLQLFSRDQYGQLALEGPPNGGSGYCVQSTSRSVQLKTCEIPEAGEELSEGLVVSVLNDGKLGQMKSGQQFFIGFDTEKRFSRVRLYKLGAFNDSLDKWNLVYGRAALPAAP